LQAKKKVGKQKKLKGKNSVKWQASSCKKNRKKNGKRDVVKWKITRTQG
jgi:hypothetical protein